MQHCIYQNLDNIYYIYMFLAFLWMTQGYASYLIFYFLFLFLGLQLKTKQSLIIIYLLEAILHNSKFLHVKN